MTTTDDLSTVSKMKTLQFQDKLAALNHDFLKALRTWYEQCPHYDFSDSVKSYLRHVEQLDKTYDGPARGNENEPVAKKEEEGSGDVSGRKIAKAKRRLGADPNKLNESVAVSTPAVRNPPRFSLGNVSAIEPQSNTPTAKTVNEPGAGAGGRKRVIRGGGPLGEKEEVLFRNSDSAASTVTIPPVTVNLPKLSTGLWDKHKNTSSDETSDAEAFAAAAEKRKKEAGDQGVEPAKAPMPLFSFGKKEGDDKLPKFTGFTGFGASKAEESKEETKKDEKSEEKKEEEKKEAEPAKPSFIFGGFGKKDGAEKSETDKPPAFSFGGFNKKEESSEKAAEKPTITFGGFGKKDDSNAATSSPLFTFNAKKDDDSATKPTLSFPTFGAKKEEDGSTPKLSFPTFGNTGGDSAPKLSFPSGSAPKLSFPTFGSGGEKPALFGNSAPSTTLTFGSSAPPTLTFGSSAPKAEENKEGGGDEEGEYVPPKAEVVEKEEPGSTYSQKCSVFKLVEKQFTKMGVGMLHLKDLDDKKSILIRAATTTGNVWANAIINSSMKASKADEKGDRLKLIFPLSATEMGQFLVRFGTVAAAEKVLDHINENNK